MATRIAISNAAKIRMLTRVKRGDFPRTLRAKRDLNTCVELIESGYLDGWIFAESDHQPVKIVDVRITHAGEDFLEANGIIDVPSNRAWNSETRMLLKTLAIYLLLVGFFILLRASGDVATFSSSRPDEIVPVKKPHSSSLQWHFGVCGLPPVE